LAGLKRLGLADRAQPLSLRQFVPAAGQGALAVEARTDATSVLEAVARIDAPRLRAAVEAERAALARLGTGCRAPVGAVCESWCTADSERCSVAARPGSSRRRCRRGTRAQGCRQCDNRSRRRWLGNFLQFECVGCGKRRGSGAWYAKPGCIRRS
jgi:porphobilinogen deaminase